MESMTRRRWAALSLLVLAGGCDANPDGPKAGPPPPPGSSPPAPASPGVVPIKKGGKRSKARPKNASGTNQS